MICVHEINLNSLTMLLFISVSSSLLTLQAIKISSVGNMMGAPSNSIIRIFL